MPLMLTDVTSTDRILGTGSYGSVVEVSKSTASLELSRSQLSLL